jgi:hypothetical protein
MEAQEKSLGRAAVDLRSSKVELIFIYKSQTSDGGIVSIKGSVQDVNTLLSTHRKKDCYSPVKRRPRLVGWTAGASTPSSVPKVIKRSWQSSTCDNSL